MLYTSQVVILLSNHLQASERFPMFVFFSSQAVASPNISCLTHHLHPMGARNLSEAPQEKRTLVPFPQVRSLSGPSLVFASIFAKAGLSASILGNAA